MTDYRINAAGVSKTLKAASTDAEGFGTDLKPLDGYVTSAAGGCGGSGAIVPALETLFTYESTNLNQMVKQIESCFTGAALATTAYVHGDDQMVLNAQRNAAAGKTSDIPTKWLN